HIMTTSEIATVLAWHDALNAADLDTLVALSSETSKSATPTCRARHEALREWAAATKPPRNQVACTCVTESWSSNKRSAARTTRRDEDCRVSIPGRPRSRHFGVPSPRSGVGVGGHRTHRGRPGRLRS
ncbi:hypothetical protein I552_0145, partial [Mycobacterium xenopi 3993]